MIKSDNICISESVSFKILGECETYKYLGMFEALGVDEQNIKQLMKGRFFGRLKKCLTAFYVMATRCVRLTVMPLFAYTFVRWIQTELDSIKIVNSTSKASSAFVCNETVYPA